MNSLPPELLTSIVEAAAECSSIYESYSTRLQTLSALALKIYLFTEEELEDYVKTERSKAVVNLRYGYWAPKVTSKLSCIELSGFAKLEEIRLDGCRDLSLASFAVHPNLTRICVSEGTVTYDPLLDADYTLKNVVDLTLENVKLHLSTDYTVGSTSRFFSPKHFPALKVLGLFDFTTTLPSGCSFSTFDYASPSLLNDLECFTTDQPEPNGTARVVPYLFDVDTLYFRHDDEEIDCFPLSAQAQSYTPTLGSTFAETHVRLRLLYKDFPQHCQLEDALIFIDVLLKQSTVLEELYLDLYPRNGNGRRDQLLSEEDLEKKVQEIEILAEEKKVEILWESHKDDWCRNRVSKEFWRRCKEKKSEGK